MNEVGQMTIREAILDDAPTLLALMVAAFAEYEGLLDPPSGAHGETVATVVRKLSSGGAALALVDGEPAGFAFYEPDDDLLYFGRLSVLSRFRNRGIGRALLDYVEARARHTGAAGVSLGVRLQLPHLVARYERLGYHITEYMTHDGYDKPTYVYMEKRFARD
jgi:ribosomal protein S18 acetylase RimI-like enzyme